MSDELIRKLLDAEDRELAALRELDEAKAEIARLRAAVDAARALLDDLDANADFEEDYNPPTAELFTHRTTALRRALAAAPAPAEDEDGGQR